MKASVAIHFAGLAPSPALESAIHARLAHLERPCPDVTAWRVTVGQEGHHQQHGRPFSVRVDATLPGHDAVVTHRDDPDVHVALRDALDAARRRVEDAVRIRRGQVKQHVVARPDAEGA